MTGLGCMHVPAQTGRQAGRQAGRLHTHAGTFCVHNHRGGTGRQASRQAGRQASRQAGKQAGRQAGRQATYACGYILCA